MTVLDTSNVGHGGVSRWVGTGVEKTRTIVKKVNEGKDRIPTCVATVGVLLNVETKRVASDMSVSSLVSTLIKFNLKKNRRQRTLLNWTILKRIILKKIKNCPTKNRVTLMNRSMFTNINYHKIHTRLTFMYI